MSIRACNQCTANTKNGQQCKRITCRTGLCYQHLKLKEGLKLKKSHIPNSGLGLFATKEFKKNDNVARYTGDISAIRIEGPYVLQVNKNKFIDAKKTSSSAGRYAGPKM